MMGPQWLCDCNRSGEAKTLEAAAEAAGKHYLEHVPALTGHYSVAVYRKRGDWAYTISTVSQAEREAYPIRRVPPAPPRANLTGLYAPAAMTFREAQQVMLATFDETMRRSLLQRGIAPSYEWRLEAGK